MTRIVTLVGAAAMALSPAAFAQTAPGQGQNNGTGYWHFNGPAEAPGSAFNEEGTGHAHYAGEQPQNTRNTASFSRYDVACSKVPTQ